MSRNAVPASDFTEFATHILADNPDFFSTLKELRRDKAGAAGEFDQMLLLHITFFKFSPTTLRRARRAWATFRECVKAPVFAYGPDDTKWEHFVRSFGFQELTTVPCADGRHRRLFINLDRPSDARDQEHHAKHQH